MVFHLYPRVVVGSVSPVLLVLSYALRKYLHVGLTSCELYLSAMIPEGARPVLHETNRTAHKCVMHC